jgi:hypothetical protein
VWTVPAACQTRKLVSPATAWYVIDLFYPAGGDIPRKTRDCLIQGSSGRFAVFAHVVFFVVQTLTA